MSGGVGGGGGDGVGGVGGGGSCGDDGDANGVGRRRRHCAGAGKTAVADSVNKAGGQTGRRAGSVA